MNDTTRTIDLKQLTESVPGVTPFDTYVRVWRFDDAPKALRDLSPHGGDEEWLGLVPPHLKDDHIMWAETGTHFGCFDVSEHDIGNGFTVLIGAH